MILALEGTDLGPAGVGVLQTALAAGALAGGAAALRAGTRVRRARAIVLGTGAWALLSALLGALSGPVPLIAVLAALGGAATLADVAATTTLQTTCPPPLLGRVFGLVEGLAVAATALGGALAPLLASHAGVAAVAALMAGALGCTALLARGSGGLSGPWPRLERLAGALPQTAATGGRATKEPS